MAKEIDLFGTREDRQACPGDEDRVKVAAHRLAVFFTEEENLPARYRRSFSPAKARKINEDAVLEKSFKANLKSWTELIDTMLSKINNRQAWRFIDLSPEISPTVRRLTDCEDFRVIWIILSYVGTRRTVARTNLVDSLGY